MKLNEVSSKNNSIKKKRKSNKKLLNLKSVEVVASNELPNSIDKTNLINEMYKPSLKPLKSRVNNHKIKSIKVNESSSKTIQSKNVSLEKIIEYDEEDLMQLNDDKINEQLENDDKINEQLENDDLVIDEVEFEEQKNDENNTIVEEKFVPEFVVDQLKSTKINEDEIHLVPRPPKEELFNIDNLNNELSSLDNKDKNLIDNKMFYKELFRLIQKGENLEKFSKSRDHSYLDTLKSSNSLNEKDLEKRIEKNVYNCSNSELIKIDKIINNCENQLDQNVKDNLDCKNFLSNQLNEAKMSSFVEKMDDSNQLTENSIKNSSDQIIDKNDTKDQINQIDNSNETSNLMDSSNQLNSSIKIDNFNKTDHLNQIKKSNQIDDSYNNQTEDSNQINNSNRMEDSNQLNNSNQDHQMDDNNENTAFNTINVAILTGLLSAFFYYYNNFT